MSAQHGTSPAMCSLPSLIKTQKTKQNQKPWEVCLQSHSERSAQSVKCARYEEAMCLLKLGSVANS